MEDEFFSLYKNDLSMRNRLFNFCRKFAPLTCDDPIITLASSNLKMYLKNKNAEMSNTTNKKNFINYLYFYLGINDTIQKISPQNFVNYIIEINNYQETIISETLKKIIVSKIIIELINKYQKIQSDNNGEDIDNLIKIKNNNMQIIKDNINTFNYFYLDINEQDIALIDIDELYKKIIIMLVKKNIIAKNIKVYNIINQLELNSINILGTFFRDLCDTLNENESYINENAITNINDFLIPEKINFYYILLKYILKTPIYIYNIKFLLKTRNIIISKLNILYPLINDSMKDKIKFVIKALADTKYYDIKYKDYEKIHKLKEILKYYQQFLFESKKEDIELIKKDIKNKKLNKNNEDILKDYDIAKKVNERYGIIKYLFFKKNDQKMAEKDLKRYLKKWDIFEKLIDDKQFKKIRFSIKVKIATCFASNSKKDKLLKIFNEDIYDDIRKKSIEFLNEDKNIINIDSEIINKIKKENKNLQKEPLKNESIDGSKSNNNNTDYVIEECYVYTSSLASEKNEISQDSHSSKNQNIFKIRFVKLIGKHKHRAEFIKDMEEYFISGGADKKIYLYDSSFNKYSEFTCKNWIYNTNKYKIFKEKVIIIGSKKELYLAKNNSNFVSMKNKSSNIEINCLNFLTLNSDNILLCGNQSVMIYKNVFEHIMDPSKTIILDKSYKGGLILNEEEVVLTSNKILSNGVDKLTFINIRKKQISEEIEGYSFIMTVSGLNKIHKEENNTIILLCACKKYLSNQKNGILLVNIKIGKNKVSQFYDTNDFEVYCFCPISYKDKIYILDDVKNKIYDTDFILVGGYDTNKQIGLIKLYKTNYVDDIFEIKFISDVSFDNFEGFANPISCILQVRCLEQLLISSIDGSVYYFDFNINYLLSFDKEEVIDITI